jgi:TolB-like protein
MEAEMNVYVIFSIILLFVGSATSVNGQPGQAVLIAQNNASMSEKNAVEDEDSASVMVTEIAKHLHKLPNQRVTVADFTDIEGNDLEEGKLFTEQIITRMLRHGRFRVIERSRLNTILDEKKLNLAGMTQEQEKEIGTLLNVDAIISGTIAHFDDVEEIHARMIDVRTGEIYCAVEHRKGQKERQKEIAALSPDDRQKVEQEFKTRETERQKDPARYELEKKHKELLQQLKRENSNTFDRVVRTLNKVKKMKDENLRKYLAFTESPGSAHLQRLQNRKPEMYQEVMRFSKELALVFKVSPAYKDLLQMQREQVLEKMRSQ